MKISPEYEIDESLPSNCLSAYAWLESIRFFTKTLELAFEKEQSEFNDFEILVKSLRDFATPQANVRTKKKRLNRIEKIREQTKGKIEHDLIAIVSVSQTKKMYLRSLLVEFATAVELLLQHAGPPEDSSATVIEMIQHVKKAVSYQVRLISLMLGDTPEDQTSLILVYCDGSLLLKDKFAGAFGSPISRQSLAAFSSRSKRVNDCVIALCESYLLDDLSEITAFRQSPLEYVTRRTTTSTQTSERLGSVTSTIKSNTAGKIHDRRLTTQQEKRTSSYQLRFNEAWGMHAGAWRLFQIWLQQNPSEKILFPSKISTFLLNQGYLKTNEDLRNLIGIAHLLSLLATDQQLKEAFVIETSRGEVLFPYYLNRHDIPHLVDGIIPGEKIKVTQSTIKPIYIIDELKSSLDA